MPTAAGLYYAVQEREAGRYPLVLIHGAGGSHLHWPAEIRRLPGHTVYAIDLPGHGKSEGLAQHAVDGFATHLLAFLNALRIAKAVLVGHSMGGAISLYNAIHHSERMAGLVLVGSGARLRVLPEILENSASAMTYPNVVEMIIHQSYGPTAAPRLLELGRQGLLDTRPTVLHGDYLACDRFDVMDQVENISAPTLILCGTEDNMTPPRYAQYLANKIPNASLTLIPEAGHMLMLEQPEAVAQALLKFVTRLN